MSQLKRLNANNVLTNSNSSLKWLKAGVMSLAVLFAGVGVSAGVPSVGNNAIAPRTENVIEKPVAFVVDETTIGGVVLDEEKQPLAGVNVVLEGTSTGTITDENGRFSFPQELKTGDVLIFSFIGYRRLKYEISDSSPDFLEINFEFDQVEILGDISIEEVYHPETTKRPNFWQRIKAGFKK